MYIITTGLNPNESYICHHGIKGQKWGVRRFQNYDGTRIHKSTSKVNSNKVVSDISKEVKKYANAGPCGNQNCQLCTWSAEMQFRGEKMLPRPILSPRDPALELNGYDIVKNPTKLSINNKNDIFRTVESTGNGSRYYCHVNWKDSVGGHEFIIKNDGGKAKLCDAQAGLYCDLSDKRAKDYVNDINYKNSFLVRMDDKEINRDILKYNDKSHMMNWDTKKDIAYMLENGMVSESEVKKEFPEYYK